MAATRIPVGGTHELTAGNKRFVACCPYFFCPCLAVGQTLLLGALLASGKRTVSAVLVRSSRYHFVKASGLRWLSLMLLTPIGCPRIEGIRDNSVVVAFEI